MRFADYVALALRSLRRSRMRSGLTIAAIVVGATGVTIMLTFVTSVKDYVVNEFVQTGQIRQIQVSETPNLTYSSGVNGNGGPAPQGTQALTPALEAKVGALPHVTGVAATGLGGSQVFQYLAFGGHKLVVDGTYVYEANGVIEPSLAAGHGLGPHDTANAVLLTEDYANALGFKGDYAKLIGKTVELHTIQGYTGVGATLPTVLPPQNQCGQPGQGSQGGNTPPPACGPTSGLPAIDLPAVVRGIVSDQGGQAIYLPLTWAIGIFDQAQPQGVQYSQQQSNPCLGIPSCNPEQIRGGGPSQGTGDVTGGWTTTPAAQYITDQGGFQSLTVNVDNTDNVTTVANAIDHLGLNTATGISALNQKKNKANGAALILGGVGLIALGIAALGVMNTMVMSVLERTREIGVMRAMGARRSTIRRLFTFEAAGLGFFGGLFGVAIGYVFVLVAKSFISKTVSFGSTLSGANFSVPLWLILVVIVGTTLIGFASGLLPARRAARLEPVEALRYE